MSRACYVDDFDPPTNAHVWVIEEGARLFDELVVVISDSATTNSFLPAGKRRELLTALTEQLPNVTVSITKKRLPARLAKAANASHLLIRAATAAKFDRERRLFHLGGDLDLSTTPVVLIPPRHLADLTAGFVRGLLSQDDGGDLARRCVPILVYDAIVDSFDAIP